MGISRLETQIDVIQKQTKPHIEILTEEPSAEAAIRALMPSILNGQATFKIIMHEGKHDLLASLSKKLKAYKKTLSPQDKVVVLIDRDKDDCQKLKQRLESIAKDAGMLTKSASPKQFDVINRIAIEELEAWFLGDEQAVKSAYQNAGAFPNSLRGNPDSIIDPFEKLERFLKKTYKKPGGKIEMAQKIGQNMNADKNKSKSFQHFRNGLLACL